MTTWIERLAEHLTRMGQRKIFGSKEWSYGGCRLIRRDLPDGDSVPYLQRYYILSTPWLGIYLHQFWSSDEDGLHCHPWRSISFLLRGWYKEEEPERQSVPTGPTVVYERKLFRPLIKYRGKHFAHRITVPDGLEGQCWTLFIRFGLKRRPWGFYTEKHWKPAEVQSRKDLVAQ